MASFVLVLGHRSGASDGLAAAIQSLGAEVREHDLWDDLDEALSPDDQVSVIVFEAGERPDIAAAALRALRATPLLERTPALLAVHPRMLGSIDPAWGFSDFLVLPCVPAELYARIRWIEWTRSEFANDERVKVGGIVIDHAAHEVAVNGRQVELTAKEFALLSFLARNRGRAFSRDQLLARVWGSRYEGGARTVDIHVRRLRMKLGEQLPLETLRGAGYKLRALDVAVHGDERPRRSRP